MNNKKHSYNYVKQQFENIGYKLLSDKYKNNNIKLTVECDKGHQYRVTYSNFQQGHRCLICYTNNRKYTYDHIKEQFEKENYKLLSQKYENCMFKLDIECSKGHQYEGTYCHFQQGFRCPICWELKSYSHTEKDCVDFIKQLTIEYIIENDRTQIINPKTEKYLELDIWIPTLKKAIEFNGEYWHNSEYSKYKDNQKVKQCEERGIDLLTIWYQDWIDNKEEQIEKLKEFLKMSNYDKN